MKANSLFTLQSIVTIVLCTSVIANAQNDPDEAVRAMSPSGNATSSDGKSSTTSGVPNIASIMKLFSSGAFNAPGECSTQNSNVDSKTSALQTAQSSLFSSQTQMLDAEEQAGSNILQLQQQAKEDGLKEADASQQYNLAVQAANAQLKIDSDQAMSETGAKLLEIKSQITKTGEAIIQANDVLRAASTAIAQAQIDQEAKCRQTADAAGKQKQKDIDTKADTINSAIASGKVTRNLNQVNASGYTNRVAAKRLVDIQNEYMTTYKNCMSGSTGATGSVQTAINQYNDAQAHYKEVIAQVTQEKADLQAALAQAQSDGQAKLTAVQTKAAQALASSLATYNSTVAHLQSDAAFAAAQVQQKQSMYNKRTALANQMLSSQMKQAQIANLNLSSAMSAANSCAANLGRTKASLVKNQDGTISQDGTSSSTGLAVKSTNPAQAGKSIGNAEGPK